MDPLADPLDYLAGIDWLGGIALAGVALAVAAVIVILIERSAHGPGRRWSDLAAGSVRRWHARRSRGPDRPWRCDRCGSVNLPSARSCYRGCGLREDVATTLPDADADVENADAADADARTPDAGPRTGG